jgi:hypothetical protein
MYVSNLSLQKKIILQPDPSKNLFQGPGDSLVRRCALVEASKKMIIQPDPSKNLFQGPGDSLVRRCVLVEASN